MIASLFIVGCSDSNEEKTNRNFNDKFTMSEDISMLQNVPSQKGQTPAIGFYKAEDSNEIGIIEYSLDSEIVKTVPIEQEEEPTTVFLTGEYDSYIGVYLPTDLVDQLDISYVTFNDEKENNTVELVVERDVEPYFIFYWTSIENNIEELTFLNSTKEEVLTVDVTE